MHIVICWIFCHKSKWRVTGGGQAGEKRWEVGGKQEETERDVRIMQGCEAGKA